MEQLVWSVIIIAFIIYTALKNRARNRPGTDIDRTNDTEYKTRGEEGKLSRYMEELLGIEKPEPQIRTKRRTHQPLKKTVSQREGPETKNRVHQFKSQLVNKHKEKQKSPLPEKKVIYHTKFPWGPLSKQDLPSAIILSEIIGPPISKRKNHRLF
ncbi:hypothetical protein SCALIN_C46_0019 [Candidatus Scalindua japonica]|uniref:Uncharacterized protein n=1 Tax=Candidatus Scalindua japonica TaxID=1284222 RepID=A0A286U4I4_9BACT|nr:hypothetical protein [Candidatus Scalindua japonica]GAX63014.1 hypothetical protein SCALIN_C46_0019 [Candidatus Scalindua japonica]